MDSLTAEERDLARQLGAPCVSDVSVNPSSFWISTTRNRDAEVCMVIRRRTGRILVFRKTFYPTGVFRLLTGGVERGETILDALRREVHEETGLEVEIRRYLALLRYHPHDGGSVRFRTHAFLLHEIGGALETIDEDEQVEEFRDIEPGELVELADALDRLDSAHSVDLDQDWSHWGRYRAIATRAVYDALTPHEHEALTPNKHDSRTRNVP